MRFQYNNYGILGQTIQSALKQAEQAIQTGRLNPVQSQQKNVQIYRGASDNTAAAGRGSRQAGTVAAAAGPDSQTGSEVYREAPADPVAGNGAAGSRISGSVASAASVKAPKTAPDTLDKLLKINFNEENILSGIVMAEVLGRPKCFRRGRW